jgi:hypothetical protein
MLIPFFGWGILAIMWYLEGRGVTTPLKGVDPFESDMDRAMEYQIARDLAKQEEWERKEREQRDAL